MATKPEIFESKLAAGFESLAIDPGRGGGSYLSLAWIQQALEFSRTAHDEMKELVPDLRQALQDRDARWLRSCVADLDKLLQVCEILLKSIADVRYYQMFVQLALQSAQSKKTIRARQILDSCVDAMPQSNLSNLSDKEETSRLSLQRANLEKSIRTLIDVWDEIVLSLPRSESGAPDDDRIFRSTLYGTRSAGVFVLLVLAAGLTVRPRLPSKPPPRSEPQISTDREYEPLWLDPLRRLFAGVKEEIVSRNERDDQPFSFLCELESVDRSVRELRALVHGDAAAAAAEDCIQRVRSSVDRVESGLPLVETQVLEIRKIVASSRGIVLQLLHTGRQEHKK